MSGGRRIRTAVILAAGMGTRMGALGSRIPKPLLPICNVPLIRRHLETLRDAGITRAVLVIGHRGHEIVRHLAEQPVDGLSVGYVEQEQRLGIAHAVGRVEPMVQEPFMLLLGDIAFEAPRLAEDLLLLPEGVGGLLAVKDEPDEAAIRKNFSVFHDDSGTVLRVVEKPRRPVNRLKGCGLYVFGEEVFDAIRRTSRTAARDEYEITDSIQILIDMGVCVKARVVVTWDINITFPADLLACNLHQLAREGGGSRIAGDVRLHPGVVVSGSVLGAGAVVEQPIAITDSLVLPGAVVSTSVPLTGVVVSGSEIIPCR